MSRLFYNLFVNRYNYTDFHELNLDWLISDVRVLAETLENFININTIKYADPIQWNIATQYEANTVVVDPATGTAYLSTKPVPSGVAISNPDYWTVIFDLDIAQANNNITLRDDGNNVLSTFTSAIGDWLLWNGTLYKVIADIALSQAYVPGYNIERYTVELFVKDYIDALNLIIGDLDDLTTTDKDNLVDAINELKTVYDSKIGDLDDLNTTAKDNLVDAINEALTSGISVTPEQFGAVGDGVTDDTTAFQNAIDYAVTNHCSVIATKKYFITSLTVSCGIYEGVTIIFNTLISNSAAPTLIVEGQSINVIGEMIINDTGDCLQCGGIDYGLAGATITINFIKSSLANCVVMKPVSDMNVQDCVFNLTRLLYKVHAIKLDTSARYVGEITINGTWFNAIDMDDNTFAIWCDCANYGMTGMYLNNCSFEGAGGGIQILNTSNTVQHQFMPLFGFGLRTSELTEQYNKTFIDYHGNGRLVGAIFVDSLPLDKVVLNDSLGGQVPASKFAIYGRVRLATGVAVFSDKAVANDKGMSIYVSDDENLVVNGAPTTYTDNLPYGFKIRNQSTLTFSFSTLRFVGEIWITCDTTANTVTVNGTTFTPTAAGEVIKISCVYLAGVGYRYLIEQNGKITIRNPI